MKSLMYLALSTISLKCTAGFKSRNFNTPLLTNDCLVQTIRPSSQRLVNDSINAITGVRGLLLITSTFCGSVCLFLSRTRNYIIQ